MNREAARRWIADCGYPGWLGLVDLVYDRLPPHLRISQVYQKWAVLRFDVEPEDEAFAAFVAEIQERSTTICSVCGGPGREQLVDGWEETICDACHARAASSR
jgi:hypothetical protein